VQLVSVLRIVHGEQANLKALARHGSGYLAYHH
jgi:hypothetical protein